jgi:hypothetical protein
MPDLCPSVSLPIGRTGRRLGLLTGGMLGALLLAGQSADALVITPSFDASWNNITATGWGSAANMAAATAVVNNVIAEFQGFFNNPVSITIAFGLGEVRGLPVTSGAAAFFDASDFPPTTQFTLAQVKALYAGAAGAAGATQVLVTANANLPAAYPNPGGSNMFMVPDAEYKALTGGLTLDNDPIDGYTGFAPNFCGGGTCPYDFSGGPPGPNAIDFTAAVEHELSHAMSRVDFAFSNSNGTPTPNQAPPFLTPQDFFRYQSGPCNATLEPRFNIACFSYDGGATNPGGRTFSNDSDSGDWINFGTDSFNAFLSRGVDANVSTADILLMCAEGWNDRAVCGTPAVSAPEPGTLALLGTSLLGLAALRRRRRA